VRGQHLSLLAVVCAGALTANSYAWADRPPVSHGAILADPTLDPVPALGIPGIAPSTAIKRGQSLAASGCPVDTSKGDNSHSKQPPPNPNCPIDPTKVAGTQESGGPASESVYFSQYDFSSPIYTTFQGQLFGTTEFDFATSAEDTYANGARTGTERISQLELTQVIRYGVTDRLSLEASVTESPSDVVKMVTYGTPVKAAFHGWEDPGFIVVYRGLAQPANSIYLDFTAEYYPDAFSALPASGEQQAVFSESFGHSFGALTLEGAGKTSWIGEGHGQLGATPSYWAEQYELEAFYRFSDRWSSSVDSEYQTAGNYFAHGQLNYYLVQDKLQATIEFEHSFPHSTSSYRHDQGNVVGIRLGYLFDLGSSGM